MSRSVIGKFDPIALIGVLNRHQVPFVVIGGIAAGLQGAIWATGDLDICYGRRPQDYVRLATALAELEARPADIPDEITVRLDAPALKKGDWWALFTKHGKLDCMGEPAPGIDHDFLARQARRVTTEETYLVASVVDLITMKQEAGRTKDRVHIELLRAIREETRSEAQPPDNRHVRG